MLNRFYSWYDDMPEPKRFYFTLFLLGATVFVPVGLSSIYPLAGVVGVVCALFWMKTRADYWQRK